MGRHKTYEDKIPFPFILDHLVGVDIVIKPMFGCYSIYANGKLCLFLMNRDEPLDRPKGTASGPMQKGVYIATTSEYCDGLKTAFPSARFEQLKESKVWIFVPITLAGFEEYVVRACEMVSKGDPRIGR